ncbi:MAG: aminotransferase [Gammaproteobacteria bacterium HGW-Gammaproteobacteria-3]|nr:MAG: aminotransferase [Gammaproteobacteria bacterium HGW-Gammaproteobacteria-3]
MRVPAKRMEGISPFYVMALLKRAKQLERQGMDVIHMEIGEPDFPTPRGIIEAGVEHLRSGNVKYTPAAGLPQLRSGIADFYRSRYGVFVAPERIFITPGASGAFLLALGVSLNPGQQLLMADPCYPCNSNFVNLFEGRALTVAVNAASGYQLTAKLIRRNWTDACMGTLIASPSNPTGTVIVPTVLEQAIAATEDLGGCFYSDEIYHGLVYGKQAASALQFSQDVFVINSFSKYFGMTGWRVGWLIVPEAFAEAAEKLAQNIFIATATHSQYAALAALTPATLDELEARRREFKKRRDFLYAGLLGLGFKIADKPEGAFYIYADCSDFSDDSFQFAHDLLETEGVAITPGLDFGRNQARHFVRFAYTASIPRMETALRRLQHFINKDSNTIAR